MHRLRDESGWKVILNVVLRQFKRTASVVCAKLVRISVGGGRCSILSGETSERRRGLHAWREINRKKKTERQSTLPRNSHNERLHFRGS